jgi:hypothetical protein
MGARVPDQQHVGVQGADPVHDVPELRVAHVRVDLGFVPDPRGGEPVGEDRPLEILVPAVAAQGQTLADRRLVDLDHADAGRLEVLHLVADG